MATALELAMERAQAEKIYSIVGNTVTYYPTTGVSKEIVIILDSASEEFAGGFEAITGEEDHVANVLIDDMARPVRGDKIKDSDDNVYVIDSWARSSNIEWRLELRLVCD